MRVCQVIDRLRGGGQERVAVELASGLVDRIERSAILATREGGDYERIAARAAVDLYIAGRRGKLHVNAWRRVSHWLAERDLDIVHTHSPGSLVNMLALRAFGKLRFRVVSHLQMLPPRGTLWRCEAVAALRFARHAVSRTIVTNPGLRKYLVERCGYRAEDVDVMFNPVDFSAWPSRGSREERLEPPVVCMVAQWRKQKDQTTAIYAARILKNSGVTFRLLLVGEEDEGLTGSARALIDALGLDEHIKIVGRRTDVAELLARAEAGILSTHFEGLPVAVVEYCAASLPCVVSDVAGTDFLISPANGIIGVPPRDPAALAAAIGDLLSDRSKARRLGMAARRHMQARADRPIVLGRLLEVYGKAMKATGRGDRCSDSVQAAGLR